MYRPVLLIVAVITGKVFTRAFHSENVEWKVNVYNSTEIRNATLIFNPGWNNLTILASNDASIFGDDGRKRHKRGVAGKVTTAILSGKVRSAWNQLQGNRKIQSQEIANIVRAKINNPDAQIMVLSQDEYAKLHTASKTILPVTDSLEHLNETLNSTIPQDTTTEAGETITVKEF